MVGGRQLSACGTSFIVWVPLPSVMGLPVSQSCSLVFLSPPTWGFACGRAVALSLYPALLVFCLAVALSSFSLFPTCGGRCWPLTICTV